MATLVDLSQWLGELVDKIEPQQPELEHAAINQMHRIKQRAAQGIAVDNQIFAAYGLRTDKKGPVNLFKTGAMMDSMTVESNDKQAHIFFDSAEQQEKAAAHNAGTRTLPQRHFFGVSLQDREEIVGDVRASLFRRINK